MARSSNVTDPRAFSCKLWWIHGNGGNASSRGVQVGTPLAVRPTDDALAWRADIRRRAISAAASPSAVNVFLPGGEIRPVANIIPPSGKLVRFAGTTDPAASARSVDAALGGAHYNRLLRSAAACGLAMGACNPVRERIACPRSH